MIQPRELKETHPIKLHAGGVSTTTEVWSTALAWARKKNHEQIENLLQTPEVQN